MRACRGLDENCCGSVEYGLPFAIRDPLISKGEIPFFQTSRYVFPLSKSAYRTADFSDGLFSLAHTRFLITPHHEVTMADHGSASSSPVGDETKRPPNCFLLFRTAFQNEKRVPGQGMGSTSKSAAAAWKALSAAEQKPWREYAMDLKNKIPKGFRFKPRRNSKKSKSSKQKHTAPRRTSPPCTSSRTSSPSPPPVCIPIARNLSINFGTMNSVQDLGMLKHQPTPSRSMRRTQTRTMVFRRRPKKMRHILSPTPGRTKA